MIIKHIHYQSRDPKGTYYYSRPDGINEYVLILAHTPAYFHSHGVQYLLEPYQLFIYDKLQPQLMYSADCDFKHDWFHFDMTDEERDAFGSLGIPFGKPITIDEPLILSEYIRMMAIEHSSGSQMNTAVLAHLLTAFFIKLSDQIANHRSADHARFAYSRRFSELRFNLMSFPYQDWSLERAADLLNMSKTWFQHNYKKAFGVSFIKDLIYCRIEYAKRILLQNDYPVSYVAALCGYKSDVYFMRQFKDQTGFTPTEYRTNMLLAGKAVHSASIPSEKERDTDLQPEASKPRTD